MGKDIWFDKNLLRSEAFRTLSKYSLLVYFDLLRRRQMGKMRSGNGKRGEWVIQNNGKIIYTYSEAEKKEIPRAQFRKAIDELQEKGLIDIAEYGTGGPSGRPHKFLLDDRWEAFGKPNFRSPRKPRRKDTRQGIGWAAQWSDPAKKKALLRKRKKQNSVSKSIPH